MYATTRSLPSATALRGSRAVATFDRALVFVVLLAVALGAAALFLVVAGAVPATDLAASVRWPFDRLAQLSGWSRLGWGAGAAAASMVALSLLVRTLRPGMAAPRGVAHHHILQSDESGLLVIDSASLETIAGEAARSAPGVIDVEVRVRGKATGPVQVLAKVDVLPGAHVRLAGDEARKLIRTSIEELGGLAVRDANVEVRVIDPDTFIAVLP